MLLAQGPGAMEGPALPLFWMRLLTQACLIPSEALTGSLLVRPGCFSFRALLSWVARGHLRGEEGLVSDQGWENSKQVRDRAIGNSPSHEQGSGYRAPLYPGMDPALPVRESHRTDDQLGTLGPTHGPSEENPAPREHR